MQKRSSLANISAKFRFSGVAAHASAAPDKGRSALDAVQVMTHAVDLMREHVPKTPVFITSLPMVDCAPNIVPDFSEVFLYARHPEMKTVDGFGIGSKNVLKQARLQLKHEWTMEIIHSTLNMLQNDVLAEVVNKNLQIVGGVTYTAEEKAFAEKLLKTIDPEGAPPFGSEAKIQPIRSEISSGSTDVGDVSWNVPVADLVSATWVPGTSAHSWQSIACSGYPVLDEKGWLWLQRQWR